MNFLSSMDSDIRLEVVHVDSEGRNRGGAHKDVAHSMPGLLHLAFSIFLFDEHDRLVLQRRASKKKLWPLFWSNSCCSHPFRDETGYSATKRRVKEELGSEAMYLKKIDRFEYKANFIDRGVEHELCEIWIGCMLSSEIRPNPDEVDSVAFLSCDQVSTTLRTTPELFTPWFTIEWPLLLSAKRLQK